MNGRAFLGSVISPSGRGHHAATTRHTNPLLPYPQHTWGFQSSSLFSPHRRSAIQDRHSHWWGTAVSSATSPRITITHMVRRPSVGGRQVCLPPCPRAADATTDEAAQCHDRSQPIRPGQTYGLTLGNAIPYPVCIRVADAIRLSGGLRVEVREDCFLVRPGDYVVEVLPGHVRCCMDIPVKGVIELPFSRETWYNPPTANRDRPEGGTRARLPAEVGEHARG